MKAKILILGPGEPSIVSSGLGTAVERILEKLQEKGNELIVVEAVNALEQAPKNQHEKTINHPFDELTVQKDMVRLQIKTNIPSYYYAPAQEMNLKDNSPAYSSLQVSLRDFTQERVKLASNYKFDLIYAHDWTSIDAALRLKQESQKPMILHIHSLDYDRSAGKLSNSWIYQLEKKGLQQADAIIAVSAYHKNIMQQHYGIDAHKIHVVHLAVEAPKKVNVQKQFKEPLVLFVGRLSGQKGPLPFLQIAEKVLQQNPNVRFVIAGSGELLKDLLEAGVGKNLLHRIHFTGFLNKEELAMLYSSSDLYCMPSVSEPFGLTALEAAAYRLPMVISKQSGAAEVLNAALTANFYETDGFAKQLIALLNNPELGEQMIKKNYELVQKRTWFQVAEEIDAVFHKYL